MDSFYRKLRKIQTKERNNAALARVGSDFYSNIYLYIQELREVVEKDPFSDKAQILRDTQRIAMEIADRREYKIMTHATLNMQGSYSLFHEKPEFQLKDTTPLNLTNEEENLYYSIIKQLKKHRANVGSSIDLQKEDNWHTEQQKQNTPPKTPVKQSKVTRQPEFTTEDPSAKEAEKEFQAIMGNIKGAKIINPQTTTQETNIPTNTKTEMSTILIFDKLPSIMGIDGKPYGPFHQQDIITLPTPNANLLIKNRKARQIKIKKT